MAIIGPPLLARKTPEAYVGRSTRRASRLGGTRREGWMYLGTSSFVEDDTCENYCYGFTEERCQSYA